MAKQRRACALTPVAMPPRGRGAVAGHGPLRCRRVRRRHCGRFGWGLATVMRHDLFPATPLAVTPRAARVREATGTAGLVAPAGSAHRLTPRRARAAAPAVALAAVAAAAHQHHGAAARAGERSGVARRLALPRIAHTARPAAKASAIALWSAHARSRLARCHTARALAVNTSGARRLETTCLVVAVAAPVLWRSSTAA